MAWRILSITLLACEMLQLCGSLGILCITFLLDWNENWPFSVLWPLLSFPTLLSSKFLQGKPFNITVIQVYDLTSNAEEAEWFCELLQDLLELISKKDVLFIIGDWNGKVGSQETLGVTSKFDLGVQNEAGQRLIEFCLDNALVIAKPSSKDIREDSTHGHHHMVNTEIRLIIFFAAKDGEALYSQQKQGQELTVAQIMNSLLPNSD